MTDSALPTSPSAPARRSRAFRPKVLPIALGVSLSGLLVLFLGVRYLPMVDLPQHAAQIATFIHWGDPAYPNADVEINWRTPYWLAYVVARIFALAVDVVVALKLVVWLSVVGNVLALGWLARRLGHDPWVALLALPTSFGYAFYFGFLSYVVAVPIGVACFVLALDHARAPRPSSGVWLAITACLTLFGHVVAFAIASASALALLVRGGGSFAARVAPIGVAALFGLAWLGDGSSMARMGPDSFDGSLRRWIHLPAALVGLHAGDRAALLLGAATLVALAAGSGRPSRQPERWLPLVLVVSGFLFFPSMLNGYGFMNGRFAAFLVPALLVAFDGTSSPRALVAGRALKLAVAAAFLLGFGARCRAFDREASAFTALVARIPAELRVRSFIFDRTSSAFPGAPLFLQFLGYYQAEKGGQLGHSFTAFRNSVLRLRPGAAPLAPPGTEWMPWVFDPRLEVPAFDYFVVKSEMDRSLLFAGSFVPVVLDAREGGWWGYRPVYPHVTAAALSPAFRATR